VSLKTALVYFMGIHAVSGIALVAAFTQEFRRAVIDTFAPAQKQHPRRGRTAEDPVLMMANRALRPQTPE